VRGGIRGPSDIDPSSNGDGCVVRAAEKRGQVDTVVLDIDGTLIDSVYAHVWSWREAFRVLGVAVATWQVHRAIGMGADRLVGAVTNDAVEECIGDRVRDRQAEFYRDLSTHLTPTPGATGLLEALKTRGLHVVLASSGSRDAAENAVEVLEAHAWIDGMITGDDTTGTKPSTEPVRRAVESVSGTQAFVVGDAVWDMESADRARYPAIGLRTGGVSACELIEAGAAEVYDDPAALSSALDHVLDTVLALGRHHGASRVRPVALRSGAESPRAQ
jgi:phosphoglycolate phosphatase